MSHERLAAAAFLLLAILALASTPATECAVDFTIRSNTQSLVAGIENALTFTVSNTGNNTANDVTVTASLVTSITSGSLLMVVGGDGRYNLSTIEPGGEVPFNMTVYVSPSAAGQIVQISFTISYRNESSLLTSTVTRSVGFSVSSRDLDSAVLIPRIVPGELNAGQNNTILLVVENTGRRGAANVSVTVGYPGGAGAGSSQASGASLLAALTSTSTGTIQGSSQFILYDSAGRWVIGYLGANESAEIPL
ncbi:MAG: hypothetical protein QFX35_07505, partial [Candidatus Verstraetearchaeota archaeon]|nr:hypothetical protein [Candidatus Verstraetearchaeota archaeon]